MMNMEVSLGSVMMNQTPFLDEVVDWMGAIPKADQKSEYIRFFRKHPYFCGSPIIVDFLSDHFYSSLLDGISVPPSEDDVFLIHSLPSLLPYILAQINDDQRAVPLRMQAVGLLLESRHPDREKYLQQYATHAHRSIRTAAQKALGFCEGPTKTVQKKSEEWIHIPCSQQWGEMALSQNTNQRNCNRCSHTVTRIMSLSQLGTSQGCVLFDPADQSEMCAVRRVHQCAENEEDNSSKEKEERVVPLPPGSMVRRNPNIEPDPQIAPPADSIPKPEAPKSSFWSWIQSFFE